MKLQDVKIFQLWIFFPCKKFTVQLVILTTLKDALQKQSSYVSKVFGCNYMQIL